jgi:hypothetical protein
MYSLLLRNIAKEVLDVFVFKNLFMEQIFPNPVKLQLTCLHFSIDSFVLEDPELLDELKTAFELIVVSEDDIEYFFVFTLSMDKSL